jgi:hypothetical protein
MQSNIPQTDGVEDSHCSDTEDGGTQSANGEATWRYADTYAQENITCGKVEAIFDTQAS